MVRGGLLLELFCTDEPEAAGNLPPRTSAKSLQESCAWLEKREAQGQGHAEGCTETVVQDHIQSNKHAHRCKLNRTHKKHADGRDHMHTAAIQQSKGNTHAHTQNTNPNVDLNKKGLHPVFMLHQVEYLIWESVFLRIVPMSLWLDAFFRWHFQSQHVFLQLMSMYNSACRRWDCWGGLASLSLRVRF